MRRGKRQILLNYLPGKTFDFEKVQIISIIKSLRGVERTDLNNDLIVNSIKNYSRAWNEGYRHALSNSTLNKPSSFVLVEPLSVDAEMFPLLLWCQNNKCGKIFDCENKGLPENSICPTCKTGSLKQVRWVKVHRCGAIQPLKPYCYHCRTSNNISLDTRGSERIQNFRFICHKCGNSFSIPRTKCNECSWTNGDSADDYRIMDIQVHRSGKTFYPHYIVLLNQPKNEIKNFLSINNWQEIAAALYFDLEDVKGKHVADFINQSTTQAQTAKEFSKEDYEDLKNKGYSEEKIKLYKEMLEELYDSKTKKASKSSPSEIVNKLIKSTGVPEDVWEKVGQEMLESIMSSQSLTATNTPDNENMDKMGLSNITLITDFPIIMATFGYSRVEYRPNQCYLNPFPPDRDHQGKFPIYVDLVQADALMMKLDYNRVLKWLEINEHAPNLPNGTDLELSKKAYFVHLFDNVFFGADFDNDNPEARLVFGLIHSFSHLCIRRAALLSGLDRTSLSEYILPRTLTFTIYCNHRSGATIGALASLYEQSLNEWLKEIENNDKCVYDPVCYDKGGNCHACTHLSETSCRFFNLNLSRAFLFGGNDRILGNIKGYFNMDNETV